MNSTFFGSIPALITNFHDDGSLDQKGYQKFVEWQLEQGSNGLVPTGTTGESPTLNHEEHLEVIKLTLEVAHKKVPIIAGTGSNSTHEAVFLSKEAEKIGVDALLIVTPYYNKPSQEGMYLHYKTIAQQVSLPIFVYNIPGRSVIDMQTDTIKRLKDDCPNIIGVKDATNNLPRATETRLAMGDDFVMLSGEDVSSSGYLAQGGDGCISVVANVAPKLSANMQQAWREQDMERFAACRDLLFPLSGALFCENSPAPAKYALSLLGQAKAVTRLPVAPISDASKKLIEQAMQHAKLL